MAKYYIESGKVRVTVSARDAQAAALFVLNQTINQLLPVETIDDRLVDDSSMKMVIQCLELLGEEFHVSEIGFGRNEVATFDSELLFKRWCELLSAMNHLMDQIDDQGI